MRRLLKFLHTVGAVGMMGGMAALVVAFIAWPPTSGPTAPVQAMDWMAKIAGWVIMPSLVLTVIAGLLSIAVTPGFHDAGWVWAKAASGILIFEGGLHVLGPIQDAAKRGAASLATGLDPNAAAKLADGERNTLLVLIAVSAANIALGIWRPRFSRSHL